MRMKTTSAVVLAAFASMTVIVRPAISHEPPSLVEYLSDAELAAADLTTDQAARLESIEGDPAAVDIRVGQAYPNAARSARALSLVLPGSRDDVASSTVSFHALAVELRSDQDYSLHARNEASGSEVSLVVLVPDVLGTIRSDPDLYKVHPLGGGLTAVYRYDSSGLEGSPAGGQTGPAVQSPSAAHPSMDFDPPIASDDAEAMIDVLVAYTRSARAETGNVDALIRLAIDQMNRVYANSRVGARVRLVHSYQTEYVPQGDLSEVLTNLQAPADGHLDEVHAVRNRYGADLTVLLTGRDSRGWCWYSYSGQHEAWGFSVVAQNCIGNYSFTQALAWNQAAGRNPEDRQNRHFPYGHALCNDLGNWRTIMSRNPDRRCPAIQPYFSNPEVSFMGTPTGDPEVRNNARVLRQTAHFVSSYRQAPVTTHAVPLLTSADNASQQGFVRIINRSDRPGTVRIHAIDDEGRRFGPVSLSLNAKQTRHFNSQDLEDGNSAKELSAGVGNGSGNWRLELATDLAIDSLAYIRTPDGFLTSIHAVAAYADDGSTRFQMPMFNPGRNRNQQSRLRLINLGDTTAAIEISGLDDRGNVPPGGDVHLTLPARSARLLTAQELEQGADDVSGQFGAGSGKWQLFVTSDEPIQAMSLLLSPTGNLTNLSP